MVASCSVRLYGWHCNQRELDKGTFAERADIQERLLASSKQGREGVLKFVIERDEECDQRHHVKKNCFRLLASQNYWELDAYLHYNA